MSQILDANAKYASIMKKALGLRYEPVAVKLVGAGESYDSAGKEPEGQISHCQAIFAAKNGECLNMPLAKHSCHVGTSAMNMTDTPDKVKSGEFHAGIGIHDGPEGAKKMIADRLVPTKRSVGEIVCPLSKADFAPDVVIVADIAERIYWLVTLGTAKDGGRLHFSTSPFQCTCEDMVSVPIITKNPNVSLGCFGCRKKTDMKADELVCGIPYDLIPGYVERLGKYETGVLTKAKRN